MKIILQHLREAVMQESSENSGCRRKCACPIWVNCSYYMDLKRQAERLSQKEYNFSDWYSTRFRQDVTMEFMGNG